MAFSGLGCRHDYVISASPSVVSPSEPFDSVAAGGWNG